MPNPGCLKGEEELGVREVLDLARWWAAFLPFLAARFAVLPWRLASPKVYLAPPSIASSLLSLFFFTPPLCLDFLSPLASSRS
jgi:hypothetical protein